MKNSKSEIVVPISRRMRAFRQRVIPIAVWTLAITVLVVLGGRRSQYIDAVGIVDAREVVIAPLGDGTLRSLRVDLFDTIKEGDVIAMMDDTLVAAELAVAEAELSRIRAELESEQKRLDVELARSASDEQSDLRRYIMNEEESRLDYLEMVVQQESDKVKLERLEVQMDRQEGLIAEDIASISDYDDVRLRYETLKKELEENVSAMARAKQHSEDTRARRIERESQVGQAGQVVDYLGPFQTEIEVQLARIREVQDKRLALLLHAPSSGQIVRILHNPGETVLSGDPVLAMQPEGVERVLAYVSEEAAQHIVAGAAVELVSQSRPGIVAYAEVLRAGSGIEEMPPRLWSTPLMSDWGFPVLIANLSTDVFLPGEVLSVRFKLGRS